MFEVVVFTSSQEVYAGRLLDLLDPEKTRIRHRLFRESCLHYKALHARLFSLLPFESPCYTAFSLGLQKEPYHFRRFIVPPSSLFLLPLVLSHFRIKGGLHQGPQRSRLVDPPPRDEIYSQTSFSRTKKLKGLPAPSS